jgi:hypothetical protein
MFTVCTKFVEGLGAATALQVRMWRSSAVHVDFMRKVCGGAGRSSSAAGEAL